MFRSRGAEIVGILGNINSPLAEKVDCYLDSSVKEEADPLGIVPTASFIVTSAICDAIASSLMKKKRIYRKRLCTYTSRRTIGKKFNFRVKDVMQPINKIACLKPQDTMREVVSMTAHPLGAACVINNGKLEGIVTEGDLRRALNNSCEIDSTKAKEIMTPEPKQVSPDSTLEEALDKWKIIKQKFLFYQSLKKIIMS